VDNRQNLVRFPVRLIDLSPLKASRLAPGPIQPPFLWFSGSISPVGRSQWPRGLRRGSTRFLELWVRTLLGGKNISVVNVVVCQVEVSASD
jgi:hypothetical protein